MSIRTHSLVATTAIIALLWTALLAGVWLWGIRETRHIEQAQVDSSLARIDAAIEHEARAMASTAKDWAIWTDTHDYVQGRDQTYIKRNLDNDTLASLDVDFIAFYDREGQLIHTVRHNVSGDEATRLEPAIVAAIESSRALMRTSLAGQPASGLLGTSAGPALVAAEGITSSDGAAAYAGALVVGKLLDGARAKELEQITTVPLAIFTAGSDDAPAGTAALDQQPPGAFLTLETTDDSITGASTLADVNGEPTLGLATTHPRTPTAVASGLLGQLTRMLLLFSVVLVVAMGFVNERLVLGRLARLKDDVRDVGKPASLRSRVNVSGSDEISDVATGINIMLEQLEDSHSDLAYLACHDPLTRLYNRRKFEAELEVHLASDGQGSILWCDLDHFKEINDSLGHAAGDELLRQLANRFAAEMRGDSIVARLGGDEFGVLLPQAKLPHAMNAAHRLLAALADGPMAVQGHEIHVSASVGVVTYPEHGTTRDDLLTRADLAMYHSKSQGRNHASAYSSDDEWRTEMTERIALSEQVVRAVRRGHMMLLAQPIVDIQSAETAAYELLLRAQDDDGNLMMPNDVIPTAERLGIIREIDRWVLHRGIEMLAREQRLGRTTGIHINLSGSAFSDPDILDLARSELIRTGIDPSRLTIEITETSAITDIAFASAFIQQLRALGCRFALDDFGAGASSLFYLRNLPVDCLKIDGALITNLSDSVPDQHFVKAIVEMCKGLNIVTVAEFVENEYLYSLISEYGVDRAQGYALGKPAPLDDYLDAALTDSVWRADPSTNRFASGVAIPLPAMLAPEIE